MGVIVDKAAARAKALRKQFNLTVPVDLNSLLEDLDVTLIQEPLESMSGFSYVEDGHKVIGINSSDTNKQRKRFTLAHELGHMLLHPTTGVFYDNQKDLIYFRNELSSTGTDPLEIEANKFAAELLMPMDTLRKDILDEDGINITGDDEKIKKLAKKYNVSITAMNIRISYIFREQFVYY